MRDVDRRDEARSVACAIIAVAKSFSLEVIAEGVETVEELEALRDIGCDRVQGYLVARPLRPQDVLEFVDDYDRTLSFRPD